MKDLIDKAREGLERATRYTMLEPDAAAVQQSLAALAYLEAENKRLREALQVLVDNGGIGPEWMFDKARAVLKEQP